MSNINPSPLKTVSIADELLSFVEPIYTINAVSSLKSFNAQDITTFSNSFINATINLNSSDYVVDPAIIHTQPVTITITGSTSTTGTPILLSGCSALRSNALYKSMQTIELKLGSTSNTTNFGDVCSALERFNNSSTEKFLNSFGLSYLDQTQDYSDLVGSSKNPLGLYSTGTDMIEPRGSYPITILTNTPTSASFSTTLRQLVPIAPLVDKLRRDGSPVQGLSHLNNISFNLTFYPNMGNRMLSLAKNRPSGDVLTVTNILVQIGTPTFSFVQLKCRNESIPRVLSYPLVSQERYIYSIGGQPLTYGQTRTFNVSSFTLSRVPHSLIMYARPSNSELINNSSGVFIPDTFAKLSKITLVYDGQTLFGQSIPENFYSMSMSNGLQDSFVQSCGLPLIKDMANSTYYDGVGSVIKLEFGKDISLFPNVCIGSRNETSFSMQLDITNLSKLSSVLDLYIVLLYSDVIQIYDNNLASISSIPVSTQDIANAKPSDSVNRVMIRNADITGAGLFSSIGNFIRSPKFSNFVKNAKTAFNSDIGKSIRGTVKKQLSNRGYSGVSNTLGSLGFGKMRKGGAMSGGSDYEGGGEYEGGAMATNGNLANSLYN